MQNMRIALISPFSAGPTRGNIITVRRISRYLSEAGLTVTEIPLDAIAADELIPLAQSFKPDLLHAFHAYHCAPSAREMAARLKVPYLVTVTGSDIYDPAYSTQTATMLALQDAAAVTCFDQQACDTLQSNLSLETKKISIVPQGGTKLPVCTAVEREITDFIILMPAALRSPKGIDLAIEALTGLVRDIPTLKLWIAGGEIEPDYAESICMLAKTRPWVRLFGEVPHDRMYGVYAASDLILNFSRFEGGMANALLEGMALGRPVIAADIPGNRSLISHMETGFLFNDINELQQQILHLSANPQLLAATGKAGQAEVITRYAPEKEAAAFNTLYQKITNGSYP
jgi:glycosyltransferase involved in cell wall biosynthesis